MAGACSLGCWQLRGRDAAPLASAASLQLLDALRRINLEAVTEAGQAREGQVHFLALNSLVEARRHAVAVSLPALLGPIPLTRASRLVVSLVALRASHDRRGSPAHTVRGLVPKLGTGVQAAMLGADQSPSNGYLAREKAPRKQTLATRAIKRPAPRVAPAATRPRFRAPLKP